MRERHAQLYLIVDDGKPMTVRQVFYQATVRSLADKTEKGYRQVQEALKNMRVRGVMPYDWLVDNSRSARQPYTSKGVADALEAAATCYRKNLWADADRHVQIWIEKDALAGVIEPVTDERDVALMVARGFSSLSFLHQAAEKIRAIGRPTFIYHLGDYDPSGVLAGEKIDETLRAMVPSVEITFERLAVLPNQIRAWRLPSRPTKQTDSRAAGFARRSVELDAIDPNALRSLVREAIERHQPPRMLKRLKAAENRERAEIGRLVDRLNS
jgi:hypothetical protein